MPTGDGKPERLLWALLDVFDADMFQPLLVRVADLERLAPDYYRELYEQAHSSAPAPAGSDGWEEVVTQQLRQKQLVPLMLSEDLQRLLVRRVAPLSSQNGLPPLIGEASDPPPWPLVAVEKIKPLPKEVRIDVGWPDDELALMGALVHGEVSIRMRETIEPRGVRFREHQIKGADSAWGMALETVGGGPSQELSSIGLTQYWRPGAQLPGLVLCIGDEPWDFAFACARDRMMNDARWLPSRAIDDFSALAAVVRIVGRVARRTTVPLRVCSVSSPDAPGRFLRALSDSGLVNGIAGEVCDPLELVPTTPGRLYERERVGFFQSVLVHHGTTPALPTPVPRNVEAESPDEMRWMTDVDVEDWVAIRHPELSSDMFAQSVAGGMARCGRDGVGYFCPGPTAWTSRSLESQTVRPKLRAASLLDQIQSAFSAAGWQATPSDKGVYLQQAADIFGGTEQLISALTDERAQLLTVFLAKGNDAPGWHLDSRRYLTFDDLNLVYGDVGNAEATILGLEDIGALARGLVLKCARCRGKRFYRLGDIGDDFQCSRCWFRQPVNQQALLIRPEPPWRYGLAEVIFQFLEHNGDLPLLSGYDFMKARSGAPTLRGRPKVQVAGELDIFDPDGEPSELDIVIAYGTELWVGEATSAQRLGANKEAELDRLMRLRQVSEILCSRGVLLISGSTWARNTIARARATLGGIWPRLETVENGRQAFRWVPPPAA